MSRIDDPSENPIIRILERLDALEKQNPLQNASIGSGGLRVYAGGVITIENGGLSITGYAEISGELRGDGTLIWTGPWAFTGAGEITGNVDLTGNLDVVDSGRITIGDVLIEDGKITAGNVVMEENKITVGGGSSPATLQDGALSFGTGGKVEADVTNGGVRLNVGTNRVYVGTGTVAMQVGSRALLVTSSGFTMSGLPTAPKSTTPDNNPIGSLFVDSSGGLFRVVDG